MASQPFIYLQLGRLTDITFAEDALECSIDFSNSEPSAITAEVIRFIPDEHIIRIASDSMCEPVFIYTLKSPSDIKLTEFMPCSRITITLIRPELLFTSGTAKPLCDMMSVIRDSRGAVSVSYLADELVYSTRHIARLFDRYLGYSPKFYCCMVRFHCALLEIQKNPGQSNSSFIENLNYSDQAHFQRDFKHYMGITPRQYIHILRLSMY